MKILICPGYVISQTDGDRHFITGKQLVNLYQIDFRKHEVRELKKEDRILSYNGFVILGPLYDGNYLDVKKELGL